MDKRNILIPTFDEAFKVTFLRRLYLDSLNLLLNPGFETAGVGDPDFWVNWSESVGDGTLANEVVIVHSGNDAAKLTAGGSINTYVSQNIVAIAVKKYLLRFRTRGDGTYGGRYALYDISNSQHILDPRVETSITGTDYTKVVKEFTSPVGCTSIMALLYCPGTNTGVCYFDTCELYLLN